MPTSNGPGGEKSISSRLVVKNLPSYYTQDKLKSHFAKKFHKCLTDVKLVTTADGKSRRFGYIGFKTDQDATAARVYYDKTFIDTSKIEVEYARPVRLICVQVPFMSGAKKSYSQTRSYGLVQIN